jgi:hypothetical protein
VNIVVMLLGGATVLAFDTIGSLASLRFRFPYSRLMFGSFAIYFVVGFVTAANESVTSAAVTAAVVGLIESTVGWSISWRIGPGRPADYPVTASRIVGTVIFVLMLGASFGALGGCLRLFSLRQGA